MMLSLLPTEILFKIADDLFFLHDINALAQTARDLYVRLNRPLHCLAIERDRDLWMRWAIQKDRPDVVQNFIQAGMFDSTGADDRIEMFIIETTVLGGVKVLRYLIDYGLEREIALQSVCQDALMIAAETDLPEAAGALFEHVGNLDYVNNEGYTPLFYAIEHNSGAIIKWLADHGADLLFPSANKPGTTALHYASTKDHYGAVQILLDRGMNPNRIDVHGNSPFHCAVKTSELPRGSSNGDSTVPALLLKHGADPYLKNTDGLTPLWLAACFGKWWVVDILLDLGLSPDNSDANGNIQEAMPLPEFQEMAERTLYHLYGLAPVGDFFTNCVTPLCTAIHMCKRQVVKVLLDHRADPNGMDPNGEMPLHLAARNHNLSSVARNLLQHGASTDAKDCHGRTALDWALASGGHDMICLLIEEGASIHHLDSGGIDPIFRVLEYGHSEGRPLLPSTIVDFTDPDLQNTQNAWRIGQEHGARYPMGSHDCKRVVKLFLERGSKIDSRDSLGRTMLHLAAFQCCEQTILLLLEMGADPNARDSFGQTPLHMAFAPHLDEDNFSHLLKGGADPNLKDINGRTPIHILARAGYADGVHSLAEHEKVDLMARDNDGNTTLHLAVQKWVSNKTTDTVRALKEVTLGTESFDTLGANKEGQIVYDILLEDPDLRIYGAMIDDSESCLAIEEELRLELEEEWDSSE